MPILADILGGPRLLQPAVPPETPHARNLIIWPQLTEDLAHRTIGHIGTRRHRAEEAGST
ncbi:hypothetical protein [Micromonospora viridifaciens]|uniref:hypothetical protein n=1 Tax=Micromonospora viridifaciens TaxID=1881 RepID=UPI0012FD14E9|nr:hypothetical protein [Micromonospora viridifaciens]